jgi:hypothetical protein
LPKQQIVSYSELDTFRQCPLKHFLAYKQRWTTEKAEDSALGKGTFWHQVLEAHHRVLQDSWRSWDETHYDRAVLKAARKAAMEVIYPDPLATPTEVQELMHWMYDGHVERYGLDKEFFTVGVEIPFMVALPWPDGRDSHYILKGKIDRLVRDRAGRLWIIDEKSCGNLPNDFEMQIDDQFGLYWWGIQKLGWEVAGAIHAAARTTRNVADYGDYSGKSKPQSLDQRFQRYYLHRTDRELKALADDAFAAARNAYPPAGMQLPLYSAPNPRQCGWKCDFKEAHLMLREGYDIKYTMESEGFHQDFTRH